jgi:hypothetical protein
MMRNRPKNPLGTSSSVTKSTLTCTKVHDKFSIWFWRTRTDIDQVCQGGTKVLCRHSGVQRDYTKQLICRPFSLPTETYILALWLTSQNLLSACIHKVSRCSFDVIFANQGSWFYRAISRQPGVVVGTSCPLWSPPARRSQTN